MATPMYGRVPWLALLLMWAMNSVAQPSSPPQPPAGRLEEFHHTRWTGAEGAPLDIRALAQTPDGWLWLGTGSGLYRFDGVHFERFPPATEAASMPIESMTVLPSGGLWIGFQAGGIAVLKDGRLTLRDQDKGIASNIVGRGFAEDLDGGVWAVSGIVPQRLVKDEWQTIDERWGFSGKSADSVAVDTEGTVWLADFEGVWYLARSASAFVHIPMERARYAFLAGPDGELWLVSERGVEPTPLLKAGTKRRRIHASTGSHSNAALFDRSHALWSVWCEGVCRVVRPHDVQEKRIDPRLAANDQYLKVDGLSSDAGQSLLEDQEGTVWVGTRNGLDRFRRNRFVRMALPAGARRFVLAPTTDGMLLGYMHRSKPQLWRTRGVQLREIEGIREQITSATRTHRGEIWIAGRDLWQGDGNTFTRLAIPPLVPNPIVRSIREDANGLWVCFHRGGLYRFEQNAWRRVDANPLPTRAPAAITIDAQQRSWFGFRDNRVVVLDGDSVRTYTAADGLTAGTVGVIHVDRHVLIGGDRGLALLVRDRFHTLKAANPEVLRGVTGIVITPSGELWLNGARGVVRMDNKQIDLAMVDPGRELAVELFDSLDGLPGVAQPLPTDPTAHADADGRLWFAATDGVAWIQPERIPRNPLKPSVQILRVHANDERHEEPPAALQLRAGTRSVQIDYTALSLAMPERVYFRYRLEDVDSGWQDVGTRRQAFYSNLGPGSYRFRVLASNNDGLWNDDGATLKITIAPTFFQTPWFALLCALGAGGLLWLLYTVRLRQVTARLRTRWQERLAERERIARELHDTFLQSTFALSLKVESAIAGIPEDHPARNGLQQALDRADEAIAEGRKRVHDLRTVEASAQYLGAALEELGAELMSLYPAHLTVRVEGQTDTLSPMVVEELLQIGREALANAFHHANARYIEVEIACQAHSTVLRIVDDGRGIDADVLASGGRADHWGLIGMRERARKIGARFELRANPPCGTEVHVSVPAHLAYSRE